MIIHGGNFIHFYVPLTLCRNQNLHLTRIKIWRDILDHFNHVTHSTKHATKLLMWWPEKLAHSCDAGHLWFDVSIQNIQGTLTYIPVCKEYLVDIFYIYVCWITALSFQNMGQMTSNQYSFINDIWTIQYPRVYMDYNVCLILNQTSVLHSLHVLL